MPQGGGQAEGGFTMKTLLRIAGVIAIIMGLLWAAQGAGYFPYPSNSFMINNVQWVYYGIATAIAGIGLMLIAQR
jgi:hypothetical protein